MLFLKTFYCRCFLLPVLCFISQLSIAQQSPAGTIKGQVVASDNKPASFVNVELKVSRQKTTADQNGYFVLHITNNLNDTLVISGVGFLKFQKVINILSSQVVDLGEIQLTYLIAELQNVEIIGRIAQSYKSDYSFAATKIQQASKDIPQSVSTITKELIKDKMELHLHDALENVASVNLYSGYEEYTIRGFRAENPHLINGLRTYNTSLTSPMLVNIERVEIIKGPTSVLYGNADPGGNINLVTKKPLQQKAYAIELYNGSWNNFRAQADITGPLSQNKNLLYRLNAGYANTRSFRNQFFDRSFQLAPSFSFVTNNKLQLNLDVSLTNTHSVIDRGVPGFADDKTLSSTPVTLMVTQPGDYLKETNLASVLSFSYKINDYISFSSAYLNYLTWQQISEHGIAGYITNDSANLYYTNRQFNTKTNSLTSYFTFQFNTGKLQHELLAGFDFAKSTVTIDQWKGELPDFFDDGIVGTFSLRNPQYITRSVNTYEHVMNDDDEDDDDFDAEAYTTHGMYIQEHITINKWQLLVGLRGEFYRSTDENAISENVLLPRIGIVYNAAKNINLYATYNKGFDPFEASSATQIFTDPFKPIYSGMFEAGIKTELFKKRLSATFALYQVTVKNTAVNANDPSNPDLYVQRGRDRARGAEAEINGNILPNLAISFTYAYNVAKIVQSNKADEIGNIKENAPRNSSGSFIKYTITKGNLKGLGFSLGHTHAGVRNTLDAKIMLPSYIIINAGLQYSYKQITTALNVNNLFNKNYWTAAYNNINKWAGAPVNYMLRIGYNF